jgi:acetylornithine deacetylase/succinyl-diaminopimelate desuccinylase-like protein
LTTAAAVGLANANAEGTANSFSRSDHLHKRDVRVAAAGVDVGTRNRLNFIAGTNTSIVVADDAGNDEIDVQVNVTSVPAHAATHLPTSGSDPLTVAAAVDLSNANGAGVADSFARSDHLHKRTVRVAKAGVDVGTRNRLNLIEGANITLTVTDDAGSDGVDITITGTGGGSADIKAATITAPYNVSEHSEVVVDATIPVGALIMLTWGATSPDDENQPDTETIAFEAVADPAGGQFTARISAANDQSFGGPFKLNYLVG